MKSCVAEAGSAHVGVPLDAAALIGTAIFSRTEVAAALANAARITMRACFYAERPDYVFLAAAKVGIVAETTCRPNSSATARRSRPTSSTLRHWDHHWGLAFRLLTDQSASRIVSRRRLA